MNIENLKNAAKLIKELEDIESAMRSVENANNLVFNGGSCYVLNTCDLKDINKILLDSIKPITLAILNNKKQIILDKVSLL